MAHRPGRRAPLAMLLGVLLASSGCVSLDPAGLPSSVLDGATGNGWVEDPENSTDVGGGTFSKRSVKAYQDDASDGEGHPGVLSILSVKGLLSPDREDLRERVREALRSNARANGLQLGDQIDEGERRLANGATSLYIAFNATATAEDDFFSSQANVKIIGEVFRCTGGATVVATGSAQIDEERSTNIGGIQTGRDHDPQTWAEIVRDPSGTIDGYSGNRGLIYNIACGG